MIFLCLLCYFDSVSMKSSSLSVRNTRGSTVFETLLLEG